MGQLPDAAARREVRQEILNALVRLRKEDRRVVLEDLLDEVYEAAEASEPAAPPPPARQAPRRAPAQTVARTATLPPAPADDGAILPSDDEDDTSLPDRIQAFCRANPTTSGVFKIRDVIAGLGMEHRRAYSQAWTAIFRSSPQSDRPNPPENPRFEWLGRSRFKLYEGEA